ncbi:MAG: hypothetical protein HC793_00105 [Aquincola sp.]|nr:hypothetical protein [Aquincola sp.]
MHSAVFYEAVRLAKIEVYTCPALFLGDASSTTWPFVCIIRSSGQITVSSAQHDSCPTKVGNPCNAATGNKEYAEVDFDFEGQAFRRQYNSLRDFELRSGLGDNWAHSFSDRLIMRSTVSSDMIWLNSDGYLEAFSEVTAGLYRSRNNIGVTLVREPDAVATVFGRWRVVQPTGRMMWFNEAGRLTRVADGPRTLTLAYCTSAALTAGECTSTDSLLSVVSATGRRLDFEYTVFPIATGGVAGGTRDRALVTRIRANGSPIAEYGYDALGRMVSARSGWPSPIPGRTYAYAEATGLCRDGNGNLLASCNPALFPYHLTGVFDESSKRVASYRYDQFGRVTFSEGADGVNRVMLSYTSAATEVQLATNAKQVFTFAAGAFRKPASTSVFASNGAVLSTVSNTYQDFRVTQQVDANGSRTNFTYAGDKEVSRTEGLTASGSITPETRTVATDWHPQLNRPVERRVRNAAGTLVGRTAWSYNDRGQLTVQSEIDPSTSATRTTTYVYCTTVAVGAGACPLEGLLMSVDGPRGDVNDVIAYDYYTTSTPEATRGDLRSITNAQGHVLLYPSYNSLGKPCGWSTPMA